MAKFLLGAVVSTIAATAMMTTSAHAINNDGECNLEGGTMVKVKGSDFCLVPIRPESYRDAIYDGNQLGVTECPGNKLNDGLYCMYPVTVRAEAESVAPSVTSNVSDLIADTAEAEVSAIVEDTVTDMVEDKVTDMVEDQVTGMVEDQVTGMVEDQVTGMVEDKVTDMLGDAVTDVVE